MKVEEGMYVLKRTISNPKPDRRVRDRWLKRFQWEEGWRFSIRRMRWQEVDQNDVPQPNIKCFELRFLGERYGECVTLIEKDGMLTDTCGADLPEEAEPALLTLVMALELSTDIDDQLEWIFRQRGSRVSDYAPDILMRLVRHEIVSLANVKAMLDESDEEDGEQP